MIDQKTKYWRIKSVDMRQCFMVAFARNICQKEIIEIYNEILVFMKKNNIVIFHERIFINEKNLHCLINARETAIIKKGYDKKDFIASILINNNTNEEFMSINIHGIFCRANSSVKKIVVKGNYIGKQWIYKNLKQYMFYNIVPESIDYTNCLEMFNSTLRRLKVSGLNFRNVLRTWIYIPNIFLNYNNLNKARNDFYINNSIIEENKNEKEKLPLPASTGIGIANSVNKNAPLMDVLAAEGYETYFDNGILQKSAYRYGSAFSRAMIINYENYRYIYLSGTAAINIEGQTVHKGSIELQIFQTIEVVNELLNKNGLSINDCVESTIYIKDKDYEEIIRNYIKKNNFNTIPYVFCIADICREDLLFEIEGIFCKEL